MTSIFVQLSPGSAIGLGSWKKESLPEEIEGKVVALTSGEDVYIYAGSTCQVYSPRDAAWRKCPEMDFGHPFTVDRGFAVTDGGEENIYLLDSSGVFLGYQKKTGYYKELGSPPFRPGRGARLVSGADGFLYAVKGILPNRPHESRILYRYEVETGKWVELDSLQVINLPGRYSSGLVRWKEGLFVWGDHHVARYGTDDQSWNKVFYVLRYRPGFEEGGMHALYSDAGKIFYTLGRGSNSLGVLSLDGKRFDYLRPRLPIFVERGDEALFVGEGEAGPALYLLSTLDQAIYSIPLASLEVIEASSLDKSADVGSIWKVHNVGKHGAQGDLVRSVDSFTNAIHIPPYVYYQRKNILRRLNLRTRSSSSNGEFVFHKRFITAGAGFAYDDKGSLYLFTGHDRKFFRVDIEESENGKLKNDDQLEHRKIKDIDVEALRELPVQPSLNTSLVSHKGDIWAVFKIDETSLYRFDVSENRWFSAAKIPEFDSPLVPDAGMFLYSTGEQLYLFRGSNLYKYSSDGQFHLIIRFWFAVSSDGGMATYDPVSEKFYVAIGGRRSELAVVDPASEKTEVLMGTFPDVVSVPGQRIWVHDGDLYIWRGHDSAEIWKASIRKIQHAIEAGS